MDNITDIAAVARNNFEHLDKLGDITAALITAAMLRHIFSLGWELKGDLDPPDRLILYKHCPSEEELFGVSVEVERRIEV